jgi:Protein of unknown function (DUF3631)
MHSEGCQLTPAGSAVGEHEHGQPVVPGRVREVVNLVIRQEPLPWLRCPRLALLSPEPGSGKTRTLEIRELLVPRPMFLLNASTAVTFRAVDKEQPTLLLDEVDALFGRRTKDENEDLRGLLNAGHRKGATVPRCDGPTHTLRRFKVYAACALAGLGQPPETLMSRSIVVRMRRRAPGEHVEPYRQRVHRDEGHRLRLGLAEWSTAVADDLADSWPEMPLGVEDRPADVWEPLLAIADAAGGDWPKRAREACLDMLQAMRPGRPASGSVSSVTYVRSEVLRAVLA